MAPSTVTYRFNRLCSAQVISEELYFPKTTGKIVQAELLLQLKSRSVAATRLVLSLCDENPYVECLVSGVGAWDYKVIIAGESLPMLLTIEDMVVQGLGKHLLRHTMSIRDQVLSLRSGLY